MPNAIVGSRGYLHITTFFPVIGVPATGCKLTLKISKLQFLFTTYAQIKLDNIRNIDNDNTFLFSAITPSMKAKMPSVTTSTDICLVVTAITTYIL